MLEARTDPQDREATQKRRNRKKTAIEKVKYRRRTFEFHPHIEEVLDELQDQLKLRSHTDVLQKAVQVLAVLTGNDGERHRVFISKGDGDMQELVIL